MPEISIESMLAAGVHFGHQRRYWNPQMKRYIFGVRNGIHIIDLTQSERFFKNACDLVKKAASENKIILFVGTKRQAQDIIEEEAKRCGCFYVNKRWLGGMLTNFKTIKQSIVKLKKIEKEFESGMAERLTKKEQSQLEKKRVKLEYNLGGIKDMPRLPDLVYVIDVKKEHIGIQEAKRSMIPVIGVADTNSSPKDIDYIIPGNDDAIRSIRLITSTIAESVIEGKAIAKSISDEKKKVAQRIEAEAAAMRKKAAAAAAAAKAASLEIKAAEPKTVAKKEEVAAVAKAPVADVKKNDADVKTKPAESAGN